MELTHLQIDLAACKHSSDIIKVINLINNFTADMLSYLFTNISPKIVNTPDFL